MRRDPFCVSSNGHLTTRRRAALSGGREDELQRPHLHHLRRGQGYGAYAYMKGWKKNDRGDFDFVDAHDLQPLTSRAEDEAYIKGRLRERLRNSSQVIVLVGENTKNLYRFVRWEIELALELGLPIIVVNLNDRADCDTDRCPAILRNEYAVHVPFKLAIIKHALDQFPAEHARRNRTERGPRVYGDDVYSQVGVRR
jgi:hypothetical protein